MEPTTLDIILVASALAFPILFCIGIIVIFSAKRDKNSDFCENK
jgi:hypothetical protein